MSTMAPDSYDALLRSATSRLADAGVPSPRADAEQLAAHAAGLERSGLRRSVLMGEHPEAAVAERLDELVSQRCARIPLQHLTGTAAFRGIAVDVGPGVFVPRPETELIVDLLATLAPEARMIVDLCSGSAALSLSLALERPGSTVIGVELSTLAMAWAERNAQRHMAALREVGSALHLVRGDALGASRSDGPLAGHCPAGAADAVVSNPPYVAEGQEPLEVEVRDHDPGLALFGGGEDGLRLPAGVARSAAALLRPGGWFICEHGSGQGHGMRRVLAGIEVFEPARTHRDLTGRERFTAARRRVPASSEALAEKESI